MDLNDKVFHYVNKLPPINYLYAKFIDFMKPFINDYLYEAKRFGSYFPKREVA